MSRGSPGLPLTLPSGPLRLLLVTGLLALLLGEAGPASLPQVRVLLREPRPTGLESEERPRGVDFPPEENPISLSLGSEAQAGTEDTLGHVPSPRWDPELDRDDLYHPAPEEAREAQDEAGLWPWALSLPQALQGPEEDRDHIYHPREDSGGP
uniref:Proline-rich acidic protein 1 n=1 Tax=Neovison vison TaxID=452646 RepID=A0A8C7AYA7_NEOVI